MYRPLEVGMSPSVSSSYGSFTSKIKHVPCTLFSCKAVLTPKVLALTAALALLCAKRALVIGGLILYFSLQPGHLAHFTCQRIYLPTRALDNLKATKKQLDYLLLYDPKQWILHSFAACVSAYGNQRTNHHYTSRESHILHTEGSFCLACDCWSEKKKFGAKTI